MNKETGGPAFPISVMTYQPDHPESPRYTTTWHNGMTLRDYFAAKAMQGWLSTYGANVPQQAVPTENIAMLAYQIADAMLKAREQ